MASISNSEDTVLVARAEDTVFLCERRQSPCFLGFLDEREQSVLLVGMSRVPNHFFAGGYEDAERKLLVVYPDYLSPEEISLPLCLVAFQYREEKSLTHRDFLGTLLSAGIRRDRIGDILCGKGLTVAVLREEIVPFVCDNIEKVGGEGVRITPYYEGDLPNNREYVQMSDTIASPRLDSVVRALLRCSREEAAQQIRLGNVSLDHRMTDSISHSVTAPCVVSVRGKGRYMVDQIGPATKKGRLAFSARKCV